MTEDGKRPGRYDLNESRRAFLEWLLKFSAATGSVLVRGAVPSWLFGVLALSSQHDEMNRHPTEDDVTLYKIEPNPAQNRDGFQQDFELFTSDIQRLELQRQQLLDELVQLQNSWDAAYKTVEYSWIVDGETCDANGVCVEYGHWETDIIWTEPVGMEDYYKKIESAIIFYSTIQTSRLSQIQPAYPADHTQTRGTGQDVRLRPVVPKFYETYKSNLQGVSFKAFANMIAATVQAVLEEKGMLPAVSLTHGYGKWKNGSVRQVMLGSMTESVANVFSELGHAAIDHLKNNGLFEIVQAGIYLLVASRNLTVDWKDAFTNEYDHTRDYVTNQYRNINQTNGNGLGSSAGLSNALHIRNARQKFALPQPVMGYGVGNVSLGLLREQIQTRMENYAVSTGKVIEKHAPLLRDIVLADALHRFETDREDVLTQPAEGNNNLMLLMMVNQVAGFIFSGYHRDKVAELFG